MLKAMFLHLTNLVAQPGIEPPTSCNNDSSVNPVDPAFQAIMRRLDDIAREGRDARKMLADESRRERDQIRASIASLNSTAGPHILSEEEDLQADARPSTSRWPNTGDPQHGTKPGPTSTERHPDSQGGRLLAAGRWYFRGFIQQENKKWVSLNYK